jgi:hypothetical protein
MSGAESDPAATLVEEDEPNPRTGEALSAEELRGATGLALAAAGASIMGFISLFRLRVDWDPTRARAFRRLLGVQVESFLGMALGLLALQRLRNATSDKRGVPFALVGVVLGGSNLVRVVRWLRLGR